ncbi:hypothetical protein AN396_00550 [Candidatus Epulonipiscium fishelsonii]|uniref:Uncharacterized protein n=1 Tax=Candidatus Epulonipiscium fishelsonii TaxID=77094 RepID=A0ACC8XF52_9FIRM|nr:hypothetical protein AN396_00550 [Epulopiscium sp. SCG-B11WGA-EpuloA1]
MKLSYIQTDNTNPYKNLALEEYLLNNTEYDECILYLWQNERTVVIGFNQNAWKECKVEELKANNGLLARRLSGGGAVFHDLGNLNFTFLIRKDYYDVEKQTEVILRAVNKFGIPAIRTGRNDISVDDKKFSGNAFYNAGDYYYHHGTLLIDVDKLNMAKYLNASAKKLNSKGVNSVRSRVCNLTEYNPNITIENMKQTLIEAFSEVYNGTPVELSSERINQNTIDKLVDKYSDWDFIYGHPIPFEVQWSDKFSWGEIEIVFSFNKGIIQELNVFTDAMEVTISETLKKAWKGVRFIKEDMKKALNNLGDVSVDNEKMLYEILDYFMN